MVTHDMADLFPSGLEARRHTSPLPCALIPSFKRFTVRPRTMADEENFEIDIYGDGSPEASPQSYEVDQPVPDPQDGNDTSKMTDDTTASNQPEGQLSSETETVGGSIDARGQVKKDHSIQEPLSQQQPTPSDSDRQAIDPGASSALLVSSISWWISDDDIRGWAHSCGYEDELKDISFKEEKRHGHSKE